MKLKYIIYLLIILSIHKTAYATDYYSNPTMAGTLVSHSETEHYCNHDCRDQGATWVAWVYYKVPRTGNYFYYKSNLWNGSTWTMDSNWRTKELDSAPAVHTSGGGTNESQVISCSTAQRDSLWSPALKTYYIDITVNNYVPFAGTFEIFCFNDDGYYLTSGLGTISGAELPFNFTLDVSHEDYQEALTIILHMDGEWFFTKMTADGWEDGDDLTLEFDRGFSDEPGEYFAPPPDPPADPPESYPDDWERPTTYIYTDVDIINPADPGEDQDIDTGYSAGDTEASAGDTPTGGTGFEDTTGLTQTESYDATIRALQDAGNMYEAGAISEFDGEDLDTTEAGTSIGLYKQDLDSTITIWQSTIVKANEIVASLNPLTMPSSLGFQYAINVELPVLGTMNIDLSKYQNAAQTCRKIVFIWLMILFWFQTAKIIRSAIA